MAMEALRKRGIGDSVRVRVSKTMVGSKRRVMTFSTVMYFLIVFVFVTAFWSSASCHQQHNHRPVDHRGETRYSFARTRKLLAKQETKKENPNRMGERCSPDDIVVHQAATPPLPNGIPTYTVQILNLCIAEGCRIGHIHLSCGWFSSARLVNPRIFRRVSFDDCLVNDGLPIANGRSVSFQYANTFHYPLSVSSAVCLDP